MYFPICYFYLYPKYRFHETLYIIVRRIAESPLRFYIRFEDLDLLLQKFSQIILMWKAYNSFELHGDIVPCWDSPMRYFFLIIRIRANIHICLIEQYSALSFFLLFQILIKRISSKQVRIKYFLLIHLVQIKKWREKDVHIRLSRQHDGSEFGFGSNMKSLVNILWMEKRRRISSRICDDFLCSVHDIFYPYNISNNT